MMRTLRDARRCLARERRGPAGREDDAPPWGNRESSHPAAQPRSLRRFGYTEDMRSRLMPLAAGWMLTSFSLNCQPVAPEPPPLVIPAPFLQQLSDGTWNVEFREDSARLARLTDAEFEELLAAYRSLMASTASPPAPAIEAASENLRRKREAARAQPARPGGPSPSRPGGARHLRECLVVPFAEDDWPFPAGNGSFTDAAAPRKCKDSTPPLNVSPCTSPKPKNKKIFPHSHPKNPHFRSALRKRGPKHAPAPVIGRISYAPRQPDPPRSRHDRPARA